MKKIIDLIHQTNEEVIEELEKHLKLRDVAERQVVEAMRYSTMSYGKRLRPLLVLECAGLFGVPRFQAIRTAAAVEMIHCYSLIHDDLPAMDNDDLRRGVPTCHKQFDEATAILAGDGLQSKAFEVLAAKETHSRGKIRAHLVYMLAKAAGAMVRGQMIDMLEVPKENVNLNYIKRLQKLKTGALIGFSCAAGAILGAQDEEDIAKLRAYADNIGLAFQITDDILDVEGDADKVGKTLGKDEKSNKATFVSLLGVDGAKTMAAELVETAVAIVSDYGEKSQTLQDIAHFILKRKY